MKTKSVIYLVFFILILLVFFINSRRVDIDVVDLMIKLNVDEIYENCDIRSNYEINVNETFKYSDPLYNYYISKYGYEICYLDKDSISKIVEIELKKI